MSLCTISAAAEKNYYFFFFLLDIFFVYTLLTELSTGFIHSLCITL